MLIATGLLAICFEFDRHDDLRFLARLCMENDFALFSSNVITYLQRKGYVG